MWQRLNKDFVLKLLWPMGFEQVGIIDPLYAAGLCSVCTLLGYSVNGEVKMILFLLWKTVDCCEVRFWFQEGIGRTVMIEGLNGVKGEIEKLGARFAFFYCHKLPHKLTAERIGATVQQLPVGTMYQWEWK